MAGGAKSLQVFRLIASPLVARFDVVDVQETCSPATRRLATVFVPGQHFTADARGDCGRVPASVFADCGIAAHPFGLGLAQLAFACIGLYGHAAGFCIFVDVDLDRRPTVDREYRKLRT